MYFLVRFWHVRVCCQLSSGCFVRLDNITLCTGEILNETLLLRNYLNKNRIAHMVKEWNRRNSASG